MISRSEVNKLLNSAEYVFAKTMPDNPHHYTLKNTWSSQKDFDNVVNYIRDNGVRERYGGRYYLYHYADGYKYWTMGNSISKTRLINRKKATYWLEGSHLLHLKEEMQQEGLLFSNNTKYIGIIDGNELVSVGGVIEYKNHILIKSLYTVPSHRGKGYFKTILNDIMNMYSNKTMKAACTKYSIRFFLRRGFEVAREYKNGITDVIKVGNSKQV